MHKAPFQKLCLQTSCSDFREVVMAQWYSRRHAAITAVITKTPKGLFCSQFRQHLVKPCRSDLCFHHQFHWVVPCCVRDDPSPEWSHNLSQFMMAPLLPLIQVCVERHMSVQETWEKCVSLKVSVGSAFSAFVASNRISLVSLQCPWLYFQTSAVFYCFIVFAFSCFRGCINLQVKPNISWLSCFITKAFNSQINRGFLL